VVGCLISTRETKVILSMGCVHALIYPSKKIVVHTLSSVQKFVNTEKLQLGVSVSLRRVTYFGLLRDLQKLCRIWVFSQALRAKLP